MVSPMTAVPSAQVATVSRAGELSLTLLGATGSIGSSTLDLVRKNRDRFRVEAVTAQRSAAALAKLARDVGARLAVVGDESCYGELKDALAGIRGSRRLPGRRRSSTPRGARPNGSWPRSTGAAGLRPTMTALERGATIALANKECLVCAGALFMRRAQEIGAIVLPVDSEHNAIFQALSAGRRADVSRIILTASGGPFRTASLEQIRAATVQQALRHPNWSMGAKITIDSATMMNKGLELIEAHHLFGFDSEPDRHRRPSAVDRARHRRISRRLHDRAARPAGHAGSDRQLPGLARAHGRCRTPRFDADGDSDLRGA